MSAKTEYKAIKADTRKQMISELQIPFKDLPEPAKQYLDEIAKLVALTKLTELLLK